MRKDTRKEVFVGGGIEDKISETQLLQKERRLMDVIVHRIELQESTKKYGKGTFIDITLTHILF